MGTYALCYVGGIGSLQVGGIQAVGFMFASLACETPVYPDQRVDALPSFGEICIPFEQRGFPDFQTPANLFLRTVRARRMAF